jgi:hypothetical protein
MFGGFGTPWRRRSRRELRGDRDAKCDNSGCRQHREACLRLSMRTLAPPGFPIVASSDQVEQRDATGE